MSEFVDSAKIRNSKKARRPSMRRIMVAGSIGNLLEWFDFAIYGYLAQFIGVHFFP
ncbi:MFS transporter, partial [Roseibium sp. RKSG952]|nr:MFS transporter [Roseibium sp. RKSG952]